MQMQSSSQLVEFSALKEKRPIKATSTQRNQTIRWKTLGNKVETSECMRDVLFSVLNCTLKRKKRTQVITWIRYSSMSLVYAEFKHIFLHIEIIIIKYFPYKKHNSTSIYHTFVLR